MVDKSRIIATFREERTNRIVHREIGVLSEFHVHGTDYRERFIQDWIDLRGEAQHNSELTLLSWDYFRNNLSGLVH